MNEQEQLMDNLLNIDLEIIDTVRDLQQENWDSGSLKQQIGDLLKVRDDMVEKLMSSNGHENQCDCGHEHHS
ncbi:MAG: hypothetical protein K5785_03295 [Nitrosarchaeum sp.]|nr:hypothetical protein [Nitrosarchaeum sp.]